MGTKSVGFTCGSSGPWSATECDAHMRTQIQTCCAFTFVFAYEHDSGDHVGYSDGKWDVHLASSLQG